MRNKRKEQEVREKSNKQGNKKAKKQKTHPGKKRADSFFK